ncbi:hypothetical protein [Polaribacter butkevichii]|uniref:Uncharacterized protein n=1 Tax=Polaribacter butkevichii TaxID=218490 RepID=A0A2P6C9P7_9FLAO|nr:hypothetical protein [Polaribacter butkevichii]PQJ69658.1 hypothetical protein BTO14_16840 [Polaribacter butkevichii]
MERLKEEINSYYSQIPKSEALRMALDNCRELLRQSVEITKNNKKEKKEEELLTSSHRVVCYKEINEGLIALIENHSSEKIKKAKKSIDLLLFIIQNETEDVFINSENKIREELINEKYIPNLIIEWTLKNC